MCERKALRKTAPVSASVESKSAVARSWERKFLGYGMAWHKKPKIARQSGRRLAEKLPKTMREARGKSLKQTIAQLNPVFRGLAAFFRFAEVKVVLEELDCWIKRKLRTLLWRHWKRVCARARHLLHEPPDADRHGQWFGRTAGVIPSPTRLSADFEPELEQGTDSGLVDVCRPWLFCALLQDFHASFSDSPRPILYWWAFPEYLLTTPHRM